MYKISNLKHVYFLAEQIKGFLIVSGHREFIRTKVQRRQTEKR